MPFRFYQHFSVEASENGGEEKVMGGFPPFEVSHIVDSVFAYWEMDHVRANVDVVTSILGFGYYLHISLHEIL